MNVSWVAASAVLLAAGCASGAASGPQVEVGGRVLSAPSCPVERQGVACPPRAVSGATVEAVRAGQVLGSTHTDTHGFFHLNVPVGRCVIRATNAGGYRSTAARVVIVRAGQALDVRLVVDSGIR